MKNASKNIFSASLIITTLGAGGAVACSAPSADRPPVETVRSSLARDLSPMIAPAELDAFARDEADFALQLYHAVGADPKSAGRNLFISPHSVSSALAMTYAGARGTTKDEMKKALHFGLPDDRLQAGFDYLDLALSSRDGHAGGKGGRPYELRIASSVWGQKSYAFESAFLDTLAVDFGAGVNVVDFVKAPADGRAAINGWVEEKTASHIKELMPEGSITSDTRLVLVNAVYFNAAWQTKFEDGSTAPASFTTLDGTVQVPTMHAALDATGYTKSAAFEAIELPYDGGDTSLLVIAPTAGSFSTFDASLTGAKVLDVLAGLQSTPVQLSFPKTKLEGTFTLGEPLRSLGMKAAFDGADFSGISKTDRLAIGEVYHRTSLDIDEGGTVAAAATGVDVGVATSLEEPPKYVTMNVDRPYVLAIVDRQTRTLLFLGRVLDPR